ncbi:hypothetical protein Sphch_3313 [Sphingobium chlorophenolicum L-1]|uniref:Uncharacterized protein n=1 Tax=Sphingobium chlorophenolicum L-1 TaxID=690566 RepID=F6F399_SPHCR|nr:hypothetical protein Sphch_3313 [Sphingobium chlorophenolicum L-1]
MAASRTVDTQRSGGAVARLRPTAAMPLYWPACFEPASSHRSGFPTRSMKPSVISSGRGFRRWKLFVGYDNNSCPFFCDMVEPTMVASNIGPRSTVVGLAINVSITQLSILRSRNISAPSSRRRIGVRGLRSKSRRCCPTGLFIQWWQLCERSSGSTCSQGNITKAGNSRARRMLESAWTYRLPARVAGDLLRRSVNLSQGGAGHRREGAGPPLRTLSSNAALGATQECGDSRHRTRARRLRLGDRNPGSRPGSSRLNPRVRQMGSSKFLIHAVQRRAWWPVRKTLDVIQRTTLAPRELLPRPTLHSQYPSRRKAAEPCELDLEIGHENQL